MISCLVLFKIFSNLFETTKIEQYNLIRKTLIVQELLPQCKRLSVKFIGICFLKQQQLICMVFNLTNKLQIRVT